MIIHHAKNIRPAQDPRFMVFGERNTGTNFLQKLIEVNFEKEFTNLIMWKHWMGFVGQKPSDISKVLAVGIIRDPINWLCSMKNSSPHAEHMSDLDWPGFLQNQWWSKHDNPDYGYEIMEDRDFETKERYANILKMRSKKLSWILDPPVSCPFILVRYEDLITDMPAVMTLIGQTFSLKMPNTFTNVSKDWKHGGEYRPRTYPRPTPDLIPFIREQLDWNLEAKV